MANINPTYSSLQTMTCTLTSLATGSARAATPIDNSANRYRDAHVRLQTTVGSGTSSSSTVELWVWGSNTSGNRPDNAPSADGAITPVVPKNSAFLGQINCPTASTAYVSNVFSVCAALGLRSLPLYWGVYVVNRSGGTLSSTAGNHVLTWVGENDAVT